MPNLEAIKLIAFDVDGVLTDGKLYYGPNGEMMKAFHCQDGHGIRLLQRAGIDTAIITARESGMVTARAAELGVPHVYQGKRDKKACLQQLMQQLGLKQENVAFVGDDILDLPALEIAGLRLTVANAVPSVKAFCNYVTERQGGEGAVREICDMLLASKITS